MHAIVSKWIERIRQDLEPTPGRMNATLRMVLASVMTLLLIMTLRMPFASTGMYFVFLVGRDSPAVSFRSGLFSLLALAASVAAVLGVVILTDNDPMARVLSVTVVSFIAGMFMLASTLPALASIWAFIFCILIAAWETSTSANTLVKITLYILGTISLAVTSVVAVEYVFGSRHPAEELQQQRVQRYKAIEVMFTLYAQGADAAEILSAVSRVSRLAAAGQSGMQHLYNTIVERNLDIGDLPIGTRVRITMLAQLMDISAAFGWQYPSLPDPVSRQRCANIAELCRYLAAGAVPRGRKTGLMSERSIGADPSLLDRVEGVLHSIISMPIDSGSPGDKQLVALPSSEVPILVPGALQQPQTIAFALKLSLCATLCYIIYQAVAWPGISTAVTTVLITGLSTSGAIKQKLIFRLAGAVIGGLILGLGATVFLFPHMDSITSLTVLVASIAFLSAWVAAGRQFNYVGLQIAFAFYIVAFEGFSAPTELAPARDRLAGILLALVVMAFVFDLIWPVRTVTAMRAALATLLRAGAAFLRLPQMVGDHSDLLHQADGLRDQVGKTVAGIRTMNDTVDYEFGVDRKLHKHAAETILRAALASVAFFWNQFAILHNEQDRDFLSEPELIRLRAILADGMDDMARSVTQKTTFAAVHTSDLVDQSFYTHPHYGEYVQNSIARFDELQDVVAQLRLQP
jgi:multidrug resistance protein MdtO